MTYECGSGCVRECGDAKSDEFGNAGRLMKRGRKKYTSFYAYDELEENPEPPNVICSDPRKRTFVTNLRGSSLQNTNPKALSAWYAIVTEYNWRDLMYDPDVLPALSGIASRVNPGLAGDYCAGLWKNGRIYGLGWERPIPDRLLSTYTAPSFSWASRIGSVRLPDGRPCVVSRLEPAVLATHCTLQSQDFYGRVSSGYIELERHVILMSYEEAECTARALVPVTIGLPQSLLRQAVYNTWYDGLEAREYASNENAELHYLLLWPKDTGSDSTAIVLRPHPYFPDDYQRIGITQGVKQIWFENIPPKSLVIRQLR